MPGSLGSVRRVLVPLAMLMGMVAMLGSSAAAQEGTGTDDGTLIPVCVQGFEGTPGVEYLTQAQIDEIEATWAAYDYSDIPPPQITGYPDPVTGSCATQNGIPIDYDPDNYTLVCVPSGTNGEGPLVPQLAINIYLGGYENIILADPVTGECPQQNPAENPPAEGETGMSEDAALGDEEAVEGDPGEVEPAPQIDVDGIDDTGTDSLVDAGAGSDGTEATSSQVASDIETTHTVAVLPATGAGMGSSAPTIMVLIVFLSAVAAILGVTALAVRHRA